MSVLRERVTVVWLGLMVLTCVTTWGLSKDLFTPTVGAQTGGGGMNERNRSMVSLGGSASQPPGFIAVRARMQAVAAVPLRGPGQLDCMAAFRRLGRCSGRIPCVALSPAQVLRG